MSWTSSIWLRWVAIIVFVAIGNANLRSLEKREAWINRIVLVILATCIGASHSLSDPASKDVILFGLSVLIVWLIWMLQKTRQMHKQSLRDQAKFDRLFEQLRKGDDGGR